MKRREYPPKEEVVEYFIKGLHTVEECAVHFGMSKTKFYTCLKKYGIVRSKEDKSKVYSRIQNTEEVRQIIREANIRKYGASTKGSANKFVKFIDDSSFSVKGVPFSVEWVINEYIDKNTPLRVICESLGVSSIVFYQILRHYNIRKTSEQRYSNILDSTIKRYGVKSTLMLPEVKKKAADTCIAKYGVDNYMKTEEGKSRLDAVLLDRYGVKNVRQKNVEHLDIWSSPDLLKEYLESTDSPQSVCALSSFFNVCVSSLRKHIHEFGLDDLVLWHPNRSHYEDEIVKYLEGIGVTNVELNNKDILDGKEIDVYLPDYKMGIEFNGDYWHSDIYFDDHNGRSTYLQDKSLLGEQKGIFIFHIFEREWINENSRRNIENRLNSLLCKNSYKVAARKCLIAELSAEQKKVFLNENHIQGNDHSSRYIGLIYEGEIVACMTFVKPKNKKYTWELSRFCSKHGVSIQGGASKLFRYFVEQLEVGDTVSSYNDITKTKGDIYKTLGFSCVSVNQPNYVWINFKTEDIRSRYQEQAGGEVERMHSLGYHRVCDAGTKTWVYTKQ